VLAAPAHAQAATSGTPQALFTHEIATDPATSRDIREALRARRVFVDADITFADLTGDGRQDAVVRVDSGGAAGAIASTPSPPTAPTSCARSTATSASTARSSRPTPRRCCSAPPATGPATSCAARPDLERHAHLGARARAARAALDAHGRPPRSGGRAGGVEELEELVSRSRSRIHEAEHLLGDRLRVAAIAAMLQRYSTSSDCGTE